MEGDRTDMSDTDALSDNEEMQKRSRALKVQKEASKEIMNELLQERADLVAKFDRDTDLKSKMIISGIPKIATLGVIRYH
jgi:hypothetical protein